MMKEMIGRLICWSLLACAIVFSAGSTPARADMIDGIVAVVDDTVIMYSDLIKKMDELGAKSRDSESTKKVVQLMVEENLIKKVYKSMNLPEVDPKQAEEVSKNMGVGLDSAAVYIMRNTLMDFMVKSRVVVTEGMIQSYFEGNKKYAGKESVHLKQILVKHRDKAEDAVKEIRKGKQFDLVAKEYSEVLADSPDIGWVPVGDLADEARKDLEPAKPGDVVGPISIGENYLVYQVVEKGLSGGRPMEEVRDEIVETLQEKARNEAFEHWLKMIMAEHYIGIFI